MKKLVFTAVAFLLTGSIFAQEMTCRQIADESVKKGSPQEAVDYINSQLSKITVPSEKRALYAYLGSLQELLCNYRDAELCYVQAAGIAAGNAEGMPKKSSERLVLDAVRTALCAGEADSALSYLNSAVRNSKSEEIQAQIKLYEQWAKLSLADDLAKAEEPIALLKTYENLSSMKSVKHSVLLTLWYTTGEKKYSEALVKEFPSSPEAGIVTGKVQILPTPFWFFLPKNSGAEILSDSDLIGKNAEKVVKAEEKTAEKPVEKTSEPKYKRLQLGLFRDKNNSTAFVNRLKEKGFDAYIQEETKESGTTYYLVLVDENSDGNMSLKLKSAGFESYPVF